MQPMKQRATNIAASAKSGMDKTKATVQEKVEIMTSKHPAEKEEATRKKDAKIAQAEMEKQDARAHNAATATGPYSYPTTGPTGTHTGTHQVSAPPGHGTGHVTEGVAGSHPVGLNAATGRSAAHNNRTGATGPYSYSTTGPTGTHTGTHQVSAPPGHGTGHVTEALAGSHPVGPNTGTGRTTAHNNRTGATGPTY